MFLHFLLQMVATGLLIHSTIIVQQFSQMDEQAIELSRHILSLVDLIFDSQNWLL